MSRSNKTRPRPQADAPSAASSAPIARPAASSAQSPIVLDNFLPYRLAVLSATVSSTLASVYSARFKLTIAEWRILANLGHAGPLHAGELAERSSMDKPKVTRALKRLEAATLVSRTIDPADRRLAQLSLTTSGQTMFRDIAALALAWERDLLAPLSANDTATFERCLRTLQAHVNDMRKTAKTTAPSARTKI